MNAVIDEALAEVSTDVEAVLNYTRNNGVRPVNYTFDPPPGVPRSSGEIDARAVTIRDARRARGLGLDVSGFHIAARSRTGRRCRIQTACRQSTTRKSPRRSRPILAPTKW